MINITAPFGVFTGLTSISVVAITCTSEKIINKDNVSVANIIALEIEFRVLRVIAKNK